MIPASAAAAAAAVAAAAVAGCWLLVAGCWLLGWFVTLRTHVGPGFLGGHVRLGRPRTHATPTHHDPTLSAF